MGHMLEYRNVKSIFPQTDHVKVHRLVFFFSEWGEVGFSLQVWSSNRFLGSPVLRG